MVMYRQNQPVHYGASQQYYSEHKRWKWAARVRNTQLLVSMVFLL